jgi:hypothetical protein
LVENTDLSGTPQRIGIEALEAPSERIRAFRYVTVTIAVGVVLLLAVCAVVLTRSPPRVVRPGQQANAELGAIATSGHVCQAGEVLPSGVSAIRVSLQAYYGARVQLVVFSGSQVVAEGRRGPEWTGSSVTVPVKPLNYTIAPATVCVQVGPNSEPIFFLGHETPAKAAAVTNNDASLSGRLSLEYLASGEGSWWSRILAVARHMGLGHALTGTWVVLLIAALMAAIGLLAVRLTWREL